MPVTKQPSPSPSHRRTTLAILPAHNKQVERSDRWKNEKLHLFEPPVAAKDGEGFRYHHHTDATNIELFFDLFFVANLSNLTSNNPVNDLKDLTQYIGWFSIIWSTWLQGALFDVRFGVDSVTTRILKVVQFCVMTALAAESPNFSPRSFLSTNTKILNAFYSIDVILLISRAALAIDYAVPLLFLWRKKQVKVLLPVAICSLIFIISVVIYAGILTTFTADNFSRYSYRAWYVILGYEVAAMMAVAFFCDVLSFKDTHIVKRVGLLTLVVLGEGILNISRQISVIVQGRGWDRTVFGESLTCVLTVFMIWSLYFRKGSEKPHGGIKQEIVVLLHYPFHLALALALEGERFWLLSEDVGYQANRIFNKINDALTSYGSPQSQADNFNTTVHSFIDPLVQTQTQANIISLTLNAITEAIAVDGANNSNIDTQLDSLASSVYLLLLDDNNINGNNDDKSFLPSAINITGSGTNGSTTSIGDLTSETYDLIFGLPFIYYLVCAGITLISLGLFRRLLLNRKVDVPDYIAIFTRLVTGIFLCLLNLMLLQPSGNLVNDYANSGVFLPTFLFALLFVAVTDTLLSFF